MAEEQQASSGEARSSLAGTMVKKALAPLLHTAVTAGTAYLTRKAMQIWQEKLLPKLDEKGGGRAVARETLENAADKVGAPASEKITALAEKLGGEGAEKGSTPSTGSSRSSDAGREAERRRREKRRDERRRALEQSGSS
jgi:hypothetical protein